MDKPVVRVSVRNLVEFILRSGDLDSRRGTADKEAMQKGSRLHRKIQRQMGGNYRAEVSLKQECIFEDVTIVLEGRADGIFTEQDLIYISAGVRGLQFEVAPADLIAYTGAEVADIIRTE